MTVGSLIAGIPDPFEPIRLLRLFVVVVVTALALVSMMFLLMVRMSDPLVPRAIFGVLNTLLYFPSGAVYPQQAFPGWMRVIASRRSVHLRRARVQVPAAQEHRLRRDRGRPALSGAVHRHHDDGGDAVVPADSVVTRATLPAAARRSGPTPDGEPHATATRARLLTAAIDLFAERGFESVTVREICQQASADVAAVNYHFRDKLGLYLAVLGTAIDHMRDVSDLTKRVAAERVGGGPVSALRTHLICRR